MRILLALVCLAGCTKQRSCATGTVFLTLDFQGGASQADSLDIQLSLDGFRR